MTNKLEDLAWKNFCKTHGWERYWGNHGRFDVFVSIAKEDIGEPYPLSVHSVYDFFIYEEGEGKNCAGWYIPERMAVIGVYLGRTMIYDGQKRAKMTFATPTETGRYRLYVAHSGIIDWFSDGCDDPCQQSGIRVDVLFETNPKNTEHIKKKFGNRFDDLSSLISLIFP